MTRLNLPAHKLHSASLIPPVAASFPSNADAIEAKVMGSLTSNEYGPVVRSAVLAKNPLLGGSDDPDSILRRMQDQHNLRRRSLKMLLERDDVMEDLDDELGLSFAEEDDQDDDDPDGDGVGYDAADSDGDDASVFNRTSLHDASQRVKLAKVNASIHEVLRAKPRALSRPSSMLSSERRLESGGIDSPNSVETEVEAEIKERRR